MIQQPNIFIPKWLTRQSIYAYCALLIVVSALFFRRIMPPLFMLIGVASVGAFFYYANVLSKRWCTISPHTYEKRLWKYGLSIRIVYVIASYIFYLVMTGKPFEFGSADAWIYHLCAKGMAHQLANGNWHFQEILSQSMGQDVAFSDSGYTTYLSLVYLLSGSSIIAARILKAVWSTWTVVLMYRLARNHFGEEIGRMTGVLCLLMPNLIYYCGLHLKETEMLFLVVFYLQKADELLILRQFKLKNLLPVGLAAFALFSFRTVLGVVALLALATALVFSSSRVVKWGRRILIGIIALGFVGLTMQEQIISEIDEVAQTDAREQQRRNMEWRAEREGGNTFAKYAGAAIFAPLIFTIPFPTMVHVDSQENQMMIHSGNYVKNILSFFTLFALLTLVLSGEWRKHVFPLAFMLGYLLVLVFSNFAQSERFHMPVLSVELMFAAMAIFTVGNKQKIRRWFNYWTILIVIANIGWAYIKLKGRGL